MKVELFKIFESAKKAADAAVEDAAEESRCLDALKQLKKIPVTMEFLVETKIGKQLRPMTKHPRKNIKAVASDVFAMWKKIVMDGTSKNNDNGNSEPTTLCADSAKEPNAKVEKFSQTETTKVQKSISSGMIKTEKNEKISRSETTFKVVNGRDVEMQEVKIEKENTSVQRLQASNGPPKLTSMVKCNDSIRDKVRELLAEAFSRVSSEADEYESAGVNACDPIRAAVSVESALFEKLGRSNGVQKSKYRSIMFNIRDQKNPDLRRRLLTGEVKPEKLVTMTVEEMASDQRKQENNQIREKTLFDCERAGAPKASTDQFKCGRCGQRKTTYYQLQTRSADEPMTTFVTCVNCNNHWKFC